MNDLRQLIVGRGPAGLGKLAIVTAAQMLLAGFCFASTAFTALAQEAPVDESTASVSAPLSSREQYCQQLEVRLTRERQQQPQNSLPQIQAEIQRIDRIFQGLQAKFDSSDCTESFLFIKSLRNTPACQNLNAQIEEGQRRLADLEVRRQDAVAQSAGRDRTRQDELVVALARNNCGPQYQQMAKQLAAGQNGKPGQFFWEDTEAAPGVASPNFGNGIGNSLAPPGVAAYRTICVRLCDGYFFPVSFQADQSMIQRDGDVCKQQCAAPAELFYYQNPGEEVEQSVSERGIAYSKLKTAFLYRKQFVAGCSCKLTEFDPAKFGTSVALDEASVPEQSPVMLNNDVVIDPAPVAPVAVRKKPKVLQPGELPFKVKGDR